MIYVKFDKYLSRNLFQKNEGIMLKYLKRFNIKSFEFYIKERKSIVSKKSVDKKSPKYNYELGG